MVVVSVLVGLVQCGCKGVLLPRPFSTQTQASQFDLTVATTTWFDAGSKMEACPLDKEARFSLVRERLHVTPTAPHLGNPALGLCIHMYTAINLFLSFYILQSTGLKQWLPRAPSYLLIYS
jgi:hypothetical protein